MEGPAFGAVARWFVGLTVLPFCGEFQRMKQHSATTTHRALPVCGWPALGVSWCTARSNAAFVVCSRCGGAWTGGSGRAGQVVCGGCGVAGLWIFPDGEAALRNDSAQSAASV